MTAKIYIVSKPVVAGREHLYLVYTPDGEPTNTSAKVIRGGPKENSLFNLIEIEVGVSITTSQDAFNGDTPADRNFTAIDLSSTSYTAESAWAFLEVYFLSLATENNPQPGEVVTTEFEYTTLSLNSNSVITTALEQLGINIENQLPHEDGTGFEMEMDNFPASQSYISGDGDDHYTGNDLDNLFFDTGGEDIFNGGSDANNTVLFDLTDGKDFYIVPSDSSGQVTATARIFNNAIQVEDTSGDTDTLHSIEIIAGKDFNNLLEVNFDALEHQIQYRDLDATGLQNRRNMYDTISDFLPVGKRPYRAERFWNLLISRLCWDRITTILLN